MKPIENQLNKQNRSAKYEVLNRLIWRRDSEGIKKYLMTSGLCRSIDDLNESQLLISSAIHNFIDLTEYLLGLGCDVNIYHKPTKINPLIISMRILHVDMIKILILAGADILASDAENISALHMLSNDWTRFKLEPIIGIFLDQLKKRYSSNEEIAKNLIATNHHLTHVSVLGDAEIIECMIQQNSPIEFVDMVYIQSTAIHMAVLLSHSKIVKILLKYISDVNVVDANYGRTPLYNLYDKYFDLGCSEKRYEERLEILKALLSRGASMTTCTSEGVFQVQNILIHGDEEAIKILIEAGLDCNVKDIRDQRTVLHYLARHNYPCSRKEWLMLYISKFDVNCRDKSGQTPLFIATAKGSYIMCNSLLELSAKTDLKDDIHNMTPLQYAYACEDDKLKNSCRLCGEVLLMYDADPQIVNVEKNGEETTIFDAALKINDFERIEPIVAHIAILEKRGIKIIDVIRSRINSHKLLKDYFDKCRDLLRERIFGRVLLFDLLTSNSRKMARYLANENIVQVIKSKDFNNRIEQCRYYSRFLGKLWFKADIYKDLKSAAAEPLCKILQNRIGKTHIIVDKVTDFLNNESLRELAKV